MAPWIFKAWIHAIHSHASHTCTGCGLWRGRDLDAAPHRYPTAHGDADNSGGTANCDTSPRNCDAGPNLHPQADAHAHADPGASADGDSRVRHFEDRPTDRRGRKNGI